MTTEGTRLVAEFLAGVLSGGGTYAVANWAFDYLATYGVELTFAQKRAWLLPICTVIASIALGLELWLGIATLTPDAVLLAATAAFTASQMLHAVEKSAESKA